MKKSRSPNALHPGIPGPTFDDRPAYSQIWAGCAHRGARHDPQAPTKAWSAGFLGGIFDAEGSCSRGILRITNKSPELITAIAHALDLFDLPYRIEPPRASGVVTVRLTGGLPSRRRFFDIAGRHHESSRLREKR
jgi:hypothetical protein